MPKYKITINDRAYTYADTVAKAIMMAGERLDMGNKKLTIERIEDNDRDKPQ
jgi:biotin synthase-like enzyme